MATAVVGREASEDLTGAITAASEAAVGTETAEATAGTVGGAIGATHETADAMTGGTGTDGAEAPLVGARQRDRVWKTVPPQQPTSMHPLACRNYSLFYYSILVFVGKGKYCFFDLFCRFLRYFLNNNELSTSNSLYTHKYYTSECLTINSTQPADWPKESFKYNTDGSPALVVTIRWCRSNSPDAISSSLTLSLRL